MQTTIQPYHPCYHHDEAARIQLETIRWPDGPYCPICGSFDRVKSIATPPKAKGGGWHHCMDCRRRFTVRVGSIFHRSHVPLHKWLLGFRLMAGSKKGFSAHQLHRHLNVDYKTAWFLEHRIRECMDEDDHGPLGGEGKIVEADETFLRGCAVNSLMPEGEHIKNLKADTTLALAYPRLPSVADNLRFRRCIALLCAAVFREKNELNQHIRTGGCKISLKT